MVSFLGARNGHSAHWLWGGFTFKVEKYLITIWWGTARGLGALLLSYGGVFLPDDLKHPFLVSSWKLSSRSSSFFRGRVFPNGGAISGALR